jgi:hypothetical protein
MTTTTTNGPRWAIVWDDDGPPRAQLPVRNLEDELNPPTVLEAHIAVHNRLRESAHKKLMAERARTKRARQEAAEDVRRRPG